MTDTDYISLIYKKMEDELSPPEDELLANWLSQSDENRKTEASILAIWEHSSPSPVNFEIDIDNDFSALMDRIEGDEVLEKSVIPIQQNNTEEPSAEKNNQRRIWMMAASITVLLGLGITWKLFSPNLEELNTSSILDSTTEINLLMDLLFI